MDPDETLQMLLTYADTIALGDEVDTIHAAHHMRHLFLDLHEWLQSGGFLPALWTRATGDISGDAQRSSP